MLHEYEQWTEMINWKFYSKILTIHMTIHMKTRQLESRKKFWMQNRNSFLLWHVTRAFESTNRKFNLSASKKMSSFGWGMICGTCTSTFTHPIPHQHRNFTNEIMWRASATQVWQFGTNFSILSGLPFKQTNSISCFWCSFEKYLLVYVRTM